MQYPIKRVIALLNDFEQADRVLEAAFTLASQNEAIVELLYVHENPLFDVPEYFRHTSQLGIDKEKIKAELIKRVSSFTTNKVAIFVYDDDTPSRVWAAAREDSEILVITAYHDSITDKLIQKLSQTVLVLKQPLQDKPTVGIVLNASSHALPCITEAKGLFQESDMHLLYDYRYVVDPSMEMDLQNLQIIEKSQREHFEKIQKESGVGGSFFVDGSFLGEGLMQYLDDKAFDLVYLCSHGDDFFVADTLASQALETLKCNLVVANQN